MSDRVTMSGPRRVPRKRALRRPKTDHGKVQKLLKDVSHLKKEIRQDVEIKNWDGGSATANVDWNGTISNQLVVPAQGLTRNDRVGDKILFKGLDFRYRCIGAANAVNTFRIIMFVDKDNSNTAVSDVLTSTYLGTTRAPLSFFNRDNRSEIKILYDKQHEFDYLSGNLQGVANIKVHKPMEITFQGASTTVEKNGLRFVVIANTATVGAMPTFEAAYRVYYSDA